MAAPAFSARPDWSAPIDPRSVRAATPPAGGILDLIDGAIEDYVLSADAMRWQPEPDVAAEAHSQAMAYGQAALCVAPDGNLSATPPPTSGDLMAARTAAFDEHFHAAAERYRAAWEEVFRHFPQRWITGIPDPSGVNVELHTSTPMDNAALVANTYAAGNWPDAPTEWSPGGVAASWSFFDEEPGSGCSYVVPDIQAHGPERHLVEIAAQWYSSAANCTPDRADARAFARFVLGFDGSRRADSTVLIGYVPTVRRGRCPAHQGPEEPTDPMERALWLRRNRNTGPRRPARAPKRIDARGTR
jgi:hypothetical protein